MIDEISKTVKKREKEIIEFLQEIIRIPSVSGSEGEVAIAIADKMRSVGYDIVKIYNIN